MNAVLSRLLRLPLPVFASLGKLKLGLLVIGDGFDDGANPLREHA